MSRIRIGADELILWLRKNGKASGIPNDEIQGLGIRIHKEITDRGGIKVADSDPVFWSNADGDKNIDKYGLPKSSAQYELETSALESLYDELNNW